MKSILILAMSGAAFAAETPASWTGVITDSMCVKDHSAMKGHVADDACARACVKSNPASYKYVLFDGKNTYRLSDQKLPEQFAAKKVIVRGTLFAKTGVIKVESMQPAK